MTKEVEEKAKIIWKEIERAKSILLHLHPSPDGDSVGSALAMMWALEGMGKKVTVISGDSSLPMYLSILPGTDKIVPKKLKEIKLSDYDLFIALDSLDEARVSTDLPDNYKENIKIIVIDHHRSNTLYGDINLVAGDYPATCQILGDLFEMWKIVLSKEIAICLFVGLYSDTGGFKYEYCTAQTFKLAARLTEIATNFTEYLFELENSNEPERMKFIGLALNNIETFYNSNLVISSVFFSELKGKKIGSEAVDKAGIANMLRSVKNWNICVSMVEKEDGLVGVSFRTRDEVNFDISKLARAVGGGGHPASSGATIFKPLDEAKKFLLEKVAEVYPELATTN